METWEKLCSRLDSIGSQSRLTTPLEGGLELNELRVHGSELADIMAFTHAKRVTAQQRWDYLVSSYPCRHYFESEVRIAIMRKPEGIAEQQRINMQETRILEWLKANLKEGVDFEIESTGVSSDFHIFLKDAETYMRFCEETGEQFQPPKE